MSKEKGADAGSRGGSTGGGASGSSGGAAGNGSSDGGASSDGGSSSDGGANNDAGTGGSSGTGGGSAAGGATAGGGSGGVAGSGTGGSGTSGECAAPADCVTKYGAAPCAEQWTCSNTACAQAALPGCVDVDGDGYGVGAACGSCSGLDCDDGDRAVHGSGQASCYRGRAGTAGVGTCHAGVSTCTAGVWSPCVGQVTPSGEACNGQDDDCNGLSDDGFSHITCGIGACTTTVSPCSSGTLAVCKPGAPATQVDGPACNGVDDDCDGSIDEDCSVCVPVDPNGNDATADGTFANPFQHVQAAIDYAVAAGQTQVCVAAGQSCGNSKAFSESVTMADGVSVYGRYESKTWTQCPTSTSTLQPKTALGVTFPSGIRKTTVLGGFTVERLTAGTTSAVTIDGARSVILSDVTITNVPSGVAHSYGVNLVNGAQATITRSHIVGGSGTVEAIGVRSVGSTVLVQNNCLTLDASGHCTGACLNTANPSIAGSMTAGVTEAYAILLDASPGSRIEQTSLCNGTGTAASAIRIRNDAKGVVVRQNNVLTAGASQNSVGVWMTDCADAAPWIVDNTSITANGTNANGKVDGIRAVGACHPVIDSNVRIIGGAESQTATPNGVYCTANLQGVASQCVVLGNPSIQGSSGGFPPVSVGVRCDTGSCMRIAGNKITGQSGVLTVGVWLGDSGTFVDNNQITGGCGSTALGIRAQNSFARLQNNRILGGTCVVASGSVPMLQSFGMRVLTSAGPNELDVHSNDIDGGGMASSCTSGAVDLDVVGTPPSSGVGIFRNDILRAGVCTLARYGFHEAAAAADPRLFEHNDLDPAVAPTALYFDSGTTTVNTAAGVDALADMTASGTISASPLFANYPTDLHLSAGSPCINTGTATGAPALDMDGAKRDATPDIGADER